MLDRTNTCGLFGWRPSWLQRFANPKMYVLVYFVVGFFQSMIFSYLTVVLSTVEKRFGLKSKEAAWIYSGNEISQIAFVFFLPFVSRVKRRTLYIGISIVISAFGSFLIAMPHFFGSQQLKDNLVDKSHQHSDFDICMTSVHRESPCSSDHDVKDLGSLVVIFIGIFSFGIGTSLYYSFGVPFLDDNTEKTDSPLLLSVVFSAKTLGPSLGYILGAACLKIWVNPADPTPDFDDKDPRWIGAWWIGFFVVGALLLVTGPFLTLFPEKLPTAGNTDAKAISKAQDAEPQPGNMSEWVAELKAVSLRLATNKIWMLNLFSSVFLLFGIVGFATFIPKYFEYQFRQTASTGGGLGGISKSVASVVGLLLSGWLIGRYRFRAKYLAGFCAFGGMVTTVAFGILTVMACPSLEIHELQDSCNSECQCQDVAYHPVCSQDSVTTFFSPCHAGCLFTNKTELSGGKKGGLKNAYWDCSCIKANSSQHPWWETKTESSAGPLSSALDTPAMTSAIDGYCPLDCNGLFYTLLGILFIVALVGSATRIPNVLINLRIIEKRDKAASLTLTVSFLSLTAFLPSPLVFGTLFDLSCKLWGEKCGEQTNCLVYDNDAMRINLGSLATACMFLGFLCDVWVWYLIGDLDMYGGDEGPAVDSGIDSLEGERDARGMVEIELTDKLEKKHLK